MIDEVDTFAGVHESTLSVMGDHLALAIDALLDSKQSSGAPWLWRHMHRRAVSSILHAFLAFESAVNSVGYELFFNPTSSLYVPEEERDVPLTLMIRNWWGGLGWEPKAALILSFYGCSFPERLSAQLRECAEMRNWIVHGRPYKQYVLIEEDLPGLGTVIDRDDRFFRDPTSGRYRSRFPNTKLASPAFVEHSDALTVNKVTMGAIKFFAERTNRSFVVPYMNKGEQTIIINSDLDIDELLTNGPPLDEIPELFDDVHEGDPSGQGQGDL